MINNSGERRIKELLLSCDEKEFVIIIRLDVLKLICMLVKITFNIFREKKKN